MFNEILLVDHFGIIVGQKIFISNAAPTIKNVFHPFWTREDH